LLSLVHSADAGFSFGKIVPLLAGLGLIKSYLLVVVGLITSGGLDY